MFQNPKLRTRILWTTLSILTIGCDDSATRIAREASDRQAQQNTAMADLQREVAGGTHRLVEADAQARKEVIGVHRDLQSERARLDTGWTALEQERRHIAGQRRTESMLTPAIQYFGGILLAVVLLGFCWRMLVANHREEKTDGQLTELLVSEILSDEPSLLAGETRPRLLNQRETDAGGK
jgi:hypothetical protein